MRRLGAISALLHLGVLLSLILVIRYQTHEPPPPPAEIAMVFDQGGVKERTAPKPTKQFEMPNGETSPQPQKSGGSPQAEPTPAKPAPPTPPQPATPSRSAPPSQNAQPAPEPPAPSPPAEVNLFPPDDSVPPEPAPRPAPAQPSETTQPAPAPPQRVARPRAPTNPSNPFAHPMQLGFGPPTGLTSRGLRHSHGLDLNVGPVVKGGELLDAVVHVANGKASADWRMEVQQWIETHKFYPPQAAENGEDGTSVITATIDKGGHVRAVKLVSSAGSRWLDLSTLGIFRDQNLPPFPDDMKDPDVTITLNMTYDLVRP